MAMDAAAGDSVGPKVVLGGREGGAVDREHVGEAVGDGSWVSVGLADRLGLGDTDTEAVTAGEPDGEVVACGLHEQARNGPYKVLQSQVVDQTNDKFHRHNTRFYRKRPTF